MNAFEATFAVSVKTDGGKVSATISADGQPTVNVTDISVVANSLVLKYMTRHGHADLDGPDADAGRRGPARQHGGHGRPVQMSGTAAKQAPGTPVRASGFGGGGRGAATSDATDFAPKPPYRPRTPAEEAAGFMLPAGYRMELVAAEPDVISPTVIEFDGNGRMYVGEMISYMMDADASREHDPISRISRWESTKGDGRYDKRTVFVDHLVAPRMILPLAGRRHPHERDRLRRSREVDRHERRRRRRQARGRLHRHRPERRRQHRAPEGGPALEHGQLDLHDLQPVPHPLDAVRLPARADRPERRPVGARLG